MLVFLRLLAPVSVVESRSAPLSVMPAETPVRGATASLRLSPIAKAQIAGAAARFAANKKSARLVKHAVILPVATVLSCRIKLTNQGSPGLFNLIGRPAC